MLHDSSRLVHTVAAVDCHYALASGEAAASTGLLTAQRPRAAADTRYLVRRHSILLLPLILRLANVLVRRLIMQVIFFLVNDD